jgi:hypothetical protein
MEMAHEIETFWIVPRDFGTHIYVGKSGFLKFERVGRKRLRYACSGDFEDGDESSKILDWIEVVLCTRGRVPR